MGFLHEEAQCILVQGLQFFVQQAESILTHSSGSFSFYFFAGERSMWLRLASNFHAKLFQRIFTLFIGFNLLLSGLLADEGGQPSLCSTAEFGIRCCGKQDLGTWYLLQENGW